MPRSRDPLGPLMNLNVGHVPLVALQRLANRMRAAKIPVTALTEQSSVDPESGAVTRALTLCHSCQGTCCTSLRVPITRSDARRLARHVGTTIRGLGLSPKQGGEDEPDDLAGYLTLGDRPCRFFSAGCTVHAARPDVCRSFGLNACTKVGTFVPLQQVQRRGKP
ncbi:YkgJ family cysteine cluster protein [Nannocystis sp. SCPEA4]|uniref:YkgJ family cysteine cluster protein n=1 Tax=Nannocystis sp. SCPEA4 TaxID=2996787 RepID=UPI002270B523|nr:YkgJ family cysteine cluster protein [Nannocystis sp. SCPEA4]MCY1062262.1 YkgJ family cysteine cluster protein [Nannocystis sp. SCPEA4]